MQNLLVAQSGGPTAAINATLAGVVRQGLASPEIDLVYGARFGIQGVLREQLLNLTELLPGLAEKAFPGEAAMENYLSCLSRTPSSALGSCRYKLHDADTDAREFEALLRIFRRYEISRFVYIGGNDSMDTVAKLSEYLRKQGIEDIVCVGAPKTIDNDLIGIDHCPGFGSAAKYIASTLLDLERELSVYDSEYCILVEIMGRNAGWLTAAAALAEQQNRKLPYLIYLSEIPFDMSAFLREVRQQLRMHRQVIVAVSEGIRDSEGRMLCEYGSLTEDALDAFGHKIASGAARVLEQAVKAQIGCKTRAIELSLLQRSSGRCLSLTDIRESEALGRWAVTLALAGQNGAMAALLRVPEGEDGSDMTEEGSIGRTESRETESSLFRESIRLSRKLCRPGYQVRLSSFPTEEIANREKRLPLHWIHPDHCHVTKECVDYLRPLIQGEVEQFYENGLPKYAVLEMP